MENLNKPVRKKTNFSQVFCKKKRTLSKQRPKNIRQLNIKYKDINIKQHSEVTYLGCMLDKMMLGEPMALKVLNKINGKLKFLYRKNRYLSPELQRMLCSVLIQPHFD